VKERGKESVRREGGRDCRRKHKTPRSYAQKTRWLWNLC